MEQINENIWTIYIHISPSNKAYIGITSREVQDRWKNDGSGYRRNPAMDRAIKKYGWDNFQHIIWAENLSEKVAKHMEVILITLFKTNCNRYKHPSYGYNLTDGGEGMRGYIMSNETKEKLRQVHLGTKASDETKKKLSLAHKGRIVSSETREKLSRAKMGSGNWTYGKPLPDETKKKLSISLSGENNPMFGKHHTKETKERMKHNYVPMSEEARNARIEYNKKNYIGGGNPKARSIVQLSLFGQFIKNWACINDAAVFIGVSESCIRGCCNGRQKTSGGFKWMYQEDYKKMIGENDEKICRGQ